MAEKKYLTLCEEGNDEIEIYPNIEGDNIPNGSITENKFVQAVKTKLNKRRYYHHMHFSGTEDDYHYSFSADFVIESNHADRYSMGNLVGILYNLGYTWSQVEVKPLIAIGLVRRDDLNRKYILQGIASNGDKIAVQYIDTLIGSGSTGALFDVSNSSLSDTVVDVTELLV